MHSWCFQLWQEPRVNCYQANPTIDIHRLSKLNHELHTDSHRKNQTSNPPHCLEFNVLPHWFLTSTETPTHRPDSCTALGGDTGEEAHRFDPLLASWLNAAIGLFVGLLKWSCHHGVAASKALGNHNVCSFGMFPFLKGFSGADISEPWLPWQKEINLENLETWFTPRASPVLSQAYQNVPRLVQDWFNLSYS